MYLRISRHIANKGPVQFFKVETQFKSGYTYQFAQIFHQWHSRKDVMKRSFRAEPDSATQHFYVQVQMQNLSLNPWGADITALGHWN